MRDPLNALPGKVRARRERLGMSLSDLANSAGLAVSTVHAIEAGRVANLRVATLLRLGHALGLSPAALLGRAPAHPAVSEREMGLVLAHRRLWPEAR